MSDIIARFTGSAKQNPPRVMQDLGIMRAKVVYNNDPLQLGRVRVMIPSLHGDEAFGQYLKPEECPWAMPCVPGGCGQDMGQMIVPVPGTFVWVFFEDNDTNKPVYLGGCPSAPSKQGRPMNNLSEESSPLQSWSTTPGKSEIPADQWEGKSTGVPQRHIIYKSQKGHTIMMDDTDGEEEFSIVDRLGQMIVFRCPVAASDNTANAMPRGAARADKGTQITKGINPSIVMRTGPTEDLKVATQYEIFQDHVDIYCEDTASGKKTITQFTPISFLQQTKDSVIEMLEKSIRIEYPNLKTFYDDSGYYTQAFGNAWCKLNDKEALLKFAEAVCHLTEAAAELKFGGCTVKVSEDAVEITAPGKISLNAPEIAIAGETINADASGSGFEADSSKIKLKGPEVHLN